MAIALYLHQYLKTLSLFNRSKRQLYVLYNIIKRQEGPKLNSTISGCIYIIMLLFSSKWVNIKYR